MLGGFAFFARNRYFWMLANARPFRLVVACDVCPKYHMILIVKSMKREIRQPLKFSRNGSILMKFFLNVSDLRLSYWREE